MALLYSLTNHSSIAGGKVYLIWHQVAGNGGAPCITKVCWFREEIHGHGGGWCNGAPLVGWPWPEISPLYCSRRKLARMSEYQIIGRDYRNSFPK